MRSEPPYVSCYKIKLFNNHSRPVHLRECLPDIIRFHVHTPAGILEDMRSEPEAYRIQRAELNAIISG